MGMLGIANDIALGLPTGAVKVIPERVPDDLRARNEPIFDPPAALSLMVHSCRKLAGEDKPPVSIIVVCKRHCRLFDRTFRIVYKTI